MSKNFRLNPENISPVVSRMLDTLNIALENPEFCQKWQPILENSSNSILVLVAATTEAVELLNSKRHQEGGE